MPKGKNFRLAIIAMVLVLSALWYFANIDQKEPMDSVRELLITPFDYPYPYRLHYVAQYRFVLQVGEFLVRRDNHQSIIGGLAHSWTISPDRKQIIFHLRPNIYTAEEVAQSLRRLISAGQTTHSNLTGQISADDIRVLDDLNLEITTKGDAGSILSPLVMADAVILPDSHWIHVKGMLDQQVDWTKTRGPYVYSSGKFPLKENEEITFVPNKNHYYYSPKQLKWTLSYVPLSKIESLDLFSKYFNDNTPTYTTIRYWDMLKLFKTSGPRISFYETKPNGISFLLPNIKNGIFRNRDARRTLLKNTLKANISILSPKLRAKQIAQPGLIGHLPESEVNAIEKSILEAADFIFDKPIVWSMPENPDYDGAWIEQLAKKTNLRYQLKIGPQVPMDARWNKSDYDLLFISIGMADTDPISGATFLFAPEAIGADISDGAILKILNSAKNSVDRSEILKTLKIAFKRALEEAVLIPISFVTNRHYHSDNIELNVKDPFAESVDIWEVRIKN